MSAESGIATFRDAGGLWDKYPVMEVASADGYRRNPELVARADVFVIIGTSLAVYPAASLLHYVRPGVPVYYIDPNPAAVPEGVKVIKATATEGVAQLAAILASND